MRARVLGWAILLTLIAASSARAEDWQVKRSGFDANLAARYLERVRRDPDDESTWKRVVALYRGHRRLADLEAQLAARDSFADQFFAAQLARERGDAAAALARYRAALAKSPDDARVETAIGELELAAQNGPEAGRALAAALEHSAALQKPRRRALLERIAQSAAVFGDPALVRRALEMRVAASDGDLRAERELGDWLAAHGEPGEALARWRTIAARAGDSPERAAESLLRVGELCEATGDDAGALDAYRKASVHLPRDHYLRRPLLERIIGVYRRKERLRELLAELTAESAPRGLTEWEAIARLHDELGDPAAAIAAYRKALATEPHAIDLRKRLVALLERAGHDDEVIAEYQRLVADAPGDARLTIELAERLLRNGEKEKAHALSLLDRLARRAPRDASVHGALADLYARIGQAELALRERELLVRLEPHDAAHWVELGELHFQRGETQRALETWRRLLVADRDRPAAMARLAEVLADHDRAGEAVELYEKARALAPQDLSLARGLASALERVHRTAEAEHLWLDLYNAASDAKRTPATIMAAPIADEARQRFLQVALREGHLPQHLAELRRRFQGPPLNEAWGLLYADAVLKLGRADEAERALQMLAANAATDENKGQAELGLAHVLKARRRLAEAIDVLGRAAQKLPARARDLYGEMAELAEQLYRDDDALKFAMRAAELAPGDARAQVRLAELAEKRGDEAQAADAYRRALVADPSAHRIAFALARLELQTRHVDAAAQLYRNVVLSAKEPGVVIDAARRAIDLSEYLGTLRDLGRALTPLSYQHPERGDYRQLLLELYDRYATPFVEKARGGDEAARAELQKLGEFGMGPLTDALAHGQRDEARIAVRLLGPLKNPAASAPLLKFAGRPPAKATRKTEVDLRTQAVLAAIESSDGSATTDLLRLASDPEKAVRAAALYGLGAKLPSRDRKITAALQHALDDPTADVRAVACLMLAGQPHLEGATLATMRARLADPDAPREVRAACGFALGAQSDHASVPALVAVLQSSSDEDAQAAAWALGRMGSREARQALLEAVFTQRPPIRRIAAASLAVAPSKIPPVTLPHSDEGLDVRAGVARLVEHDAAPTMLHASVDDALDEDLANGLSRGLAAHRDVQLRTLHDLLSEPRVLGFGPLHFAVNEVTDRLRAEVAKRIEEPVRRLAAQGDPSVRAAALLVLSRIDSASATATVAMAFEEPTLEMHLAGLAALANIGDAPRERDDALRTLSALAQRALVARDWRERAAACDAVSRTQAQPGSSDRGVPGALVALLDDENGFVREHAARALSRFGAAAVPALERHTREPVAATRATLAHALADTASPLARAPLERLCGDSDATVKRIACDALRHLPALP